MIRHSLALFVNLLIVLPLSAQNLVPNPSFEKVNKVTNR